MEYVQRLLEAGKKYFLAICAMFMTQLLSAVTKVDRIANPDKYQIELPVDQEAVSNSIKIGIRLFTDGNFFDKFFLNRPTVTVQPRQSMTTTWNL